ARPHPEEREAQQAPQTRARVRASRRMRTATISAPSCFETHRSTWRLGSHPRARGAAMLLSMRATRSGAFDRLACRAFAEKRLERRDILLVALEIARDLLIKMRGAEIKLVRGRILADEIGDLVHFRNPTVGFRRHLRQAALEPGQHLRLAS